MRGITCSQAGSWSRLYPIIVLAAMAVCNTVQAMENAKPPVGAAGDAVAAGILVEIPLATDEQDFSVTFPRCMAFSDQGELFISDGNNGTVAVYGPDGIKRRDINVFADEDGPHNGTDGLSLDGRGNIYVSGMFGCRVVRVGAEGSTLFKDERVQGQACHFVVAADRANHVYIGDWGGRLRKFSEDGALLATWDSIPGDVRRGQMSLNAATVERDGSIYVADGRKRVVRFSPEGQVLQVWALQDSTGGSLNQLDDIAVDSQGYVYVGEASGSDLVVLTPDGRRVPRNQRVLPAKVRPEAIGVDRQGYLWVWDDNAIHLRKFRIDHRASPSEGR